MIESTRKFKHKLACNGSKCDARFTCLLFYNMNYRESVEEIINAPFTKDASGKFLKCDKLTPIV